jgi:hypothetical protein
MPLPTLNRPLSSRHKHLFHLVLALEGVDFPAPEDSALLFLLDKAEDTSGDMMEKYYIHTYVRMDLSALFLPAAWDG